MAEDSKNKDCPQIEICKEKWSSNDDKLKVIHHRLDGHEEKINNFGEMKDILIELKVISSQQLKDNESRDEILKQHTDSLNQTNMALININSKFDNYDINNKEVKNELKEVKDELKAITSSNNINILELLKKGIGYVIIAGLSGGAMYVYFMVK